MPFAGRAAFLVSHLIAPARERSPGGLCLAIFESVERFFRSDPLSSRLFAAGEQPHSERAVSVAEAKKRRVKIASPKSESNGPTLDGEPFLWDQSDRKSPEKSESATAETARLRLRAQDRLKRLMQMRKAPNPETEAARLIHELRVHQIELELQQEELRLARSEMEKLLARYTDLYDSAPVSYLTLDREGTILLLNSSAARLLGVDRTLLDKRHLRQFVIEGDRQALNDFMERVFSSRTRASCEIALRQAGARPVFVQIEGTRSEDERECRAVLVDLSERKLAEDSLRASERRFQGLFENSRDAIMTMDSRTWRFTSGNPATLRMFGVKSEAEFVSHSPWDLSPERQPDGRDSIEKAKEMTERALREGAHFFEWTHRRVDGGEFPADILLTRMDQGGQPILQATVRDIAKRKQTESALRESEAHYRAVVQSANDAIVSADGEGAIVGWNPGAERVFGYTEPEVRGQPITLLLPTAYHDRHTAGLARVRSGGESHIFGTPVEFEGRRKGGEEFKLELSLSEWEVSGETFRTAIVRDISERKQAEEALRQRLAALEALHTVSAALREAQSHNEALPILLEEMLAAVETDAGAIWLYDQERAELRAAVTRGWVQRICESPMKPNEGIIGTVFASGNAYLSTALSNDTVTHASVRSQIPAGWGGACVPLRTGSVTVGVLFVSTLLPRQVTPEQVQLLESLAELAGAALHRMSLHDETVRRLAQLQALNHVDQTISASTDLRMTLNILLEHVVTQLKVDATDVLLLSPHTHTLEYAAGRGFRTRAAESVDSRLGDGCAGRVALERRALQLEAPAHLDESSQVGSLWGSEGFTNYYGVPLIAKGEVKGVLEVFHREPRAVTKDWSSFLETLAQQAAIAIDNAQLFDHMQRSNIDLALAYEATIEGWSRALDLRDHETEGHTRRVTEMTIRLARAMGIGDAELVHIRRGALLHDIGKMGIPDNVLLKRGPLSDDEWKVMPQHAQLAYDLLSPIKYLRLALDIPYCHHERWDGTGYPRGLKGERIPLAARLFAVADVWDALRSDRPYREAWPEERVLEHIRARAGTHFDPRVVELFLHSMKEGK
jgi:PAS domain S-box-containing protein